MRKELLLAIVAMFVVCGCGKKEEVTTGNVSAIDVPWEDGVKVKGTILDNFCIGENKMKLPELARTRSKESAILPNCAAGGYSLYYDGKIIMFDDKSNAKILKFLKNPKNTLNVEVIAKKVNDRLVLERIKNQ